MVNAHMWTIKPTADEMTIAWQGKRIANLEADLAALREAVAWERECRQVRDEKLAPFLRARAHYAAARAEVDRLMGDGE